jgi:very-short-patch-repair endonuclease
LFRKHKLPKPTLNVPLQLGSDWIEVDCLWRDQRVIAELDGHAAHGTRAAFERDRNRDRALQALGWRTVRVTWRQLHEHESAVVADLRRLLTASPASAACRAARTPRTP